MHVHLWDGPSSSLQFADLPINELVEGWVYRNQTFLALDDLPLRKHDAAFEAGLRLARERGMQAYCVQPMTTVSRRLGAMGFASREPHFCALEDVAYLQRVAELAGLCLDDTLTQKVFDEERNRLQLLIEVDRFSLDLEDSELGFASLLESLQSWAPDAFVGIYVYDSADECLRLTVLDRSWGDKMAPGGTAPLHRTLAGQVFRSRKTLALDASGLAALPFESVKRGMEMGVNSLCLSPIVSAIGAVGVLQVARRNGQSFSPREIETLEQAAAAIAPSLDRRLASSTAPVSKSAEMPFPASLAAANLFSFATPQALLSSQQLLSTYSQPSKVGLCILDTNFVYLAINNTLAEMNGIPAASHLGKTVREVLGETAGLVEPLLQRVLATGEAIQDWEISSILANRSEPGHWIAHYLPIRDAAGDVTQVGVIVVEVTEKRKLERSLHTVSQRLQDEKHRQEVVFEVGRVLAARSPLPQLFLRVSACLRRVLRQEYAALAIYEEQSGRLVRQALDFPLQRQPAAQDEIPSRQDPQRIALVEQRPLILSRAELQESASETAGNFLAEGMKALCCVPLLRSHGASGVMVLGSTRAEAFKSEDLILLNQVAAQLAAALENLQISKEVQDLRERMEKIPGFLGGKRRTAAPIDDIVGESDALGEVLRLVSIVAGSDATVLLRGETGTGKGLVARAIHRASRRSQRAFVTLNCAAIPTGLLESELFGHEKGAFTGAVSQKVGRLEMADGGTLFLDEIGEIPLELQPKLLRVLQDHEFERLGGNRTIKVNLRLIAATNRDLDRSVAEKEFRSDLFYRLNVFPIRIPPLRERPEDIPMLVRYFVDKFAGMMGRSVETIPEETMQALRDWEWPGNIRELGNFIERSVILTDGPTLQAPMADFETHETVRTSEHSLEKAERAHILRVLRETRGKIAGPKGAAFRLGLKRTTLQSMMKRLGITPKDYS